jgi:hypothetical protein
MTLSQTNWRDDNKYSFVLSYNKTEISRDGIGSISYQVRSILRDINDERYFYNYRILEQLIEE